MATVDNTATPSSRPISERLASYPIVGRAFTKLSGVYDTYGKHSSHASIRRCVDAVETSISAHKGKVEPLVHAGLDRLEHSVDTLRHSSLADRAVTAATAATSAAATVTSAATSIEHRGVSLFSSVAASAAAVESRVAALAGAGLDVADAIIDWALPELPKKNDDAQAGEWPTPAEAARGAAAEADAAPAATAAHVGDGTRRILGRVFGMARKVRARIVPGAFHRLGQLRQRSRTAVAGASQRVTSAVSSRVRAAKQKVSEQQGNISSNTQARVRRVRTAVHAKMAEIRLQRIVNQLIALGLSVSARSLELAMSFTPDSFISLFRRSTGFDLRQIRRRLRIVATRAKNGQPLIPPSAFSTATPTPTKTRHPDSLSSPGAAAAPSDASTSASASAAAAAGRSPTTHNPTGEPHVRMVSEEEFRKLAAAQHSQQDEGEDEGEENNGEPEEPYSSEEVDDNDDENDDEGEGAADTSVVS